MQCGAHSPPSYKGTCGQPATMAFLNEESNRWYLRCEDCAYEAYVHADRHLLGLKRLSIEEFLVWLTHHE